MRIVERDIEDSANEVTGWERCDELHNLPRSSVSPNLLPFNNEC